MPTKKVQKKKDRAYREKLLDDIGVTDREIAESIKCGLKSDNPTERSKALDIAERWKFDEVKKEEAKLEMLPLANVKADDYRRLANKCLYCKHKQFEPIRGPKPTEPAGGPEVGMSVPDSMLPKVGEPYGGAPTDTGNPGDTVTPVPIHGALLPDYIDAISEREAKDDKDAPK